MTTYLVYTFREPELLARAISQLAPHRVIVHVDKKVDEAPFRSALTVGDASRVTFLADRVLVNWGGYSQVEAIRRLVREGIRASQPNEYLVLLSGQDYPIKSPGELDALFANSGGKQFMRYFEISTSEEKYTWQVDRRHHRDLPFFSSYTLNPRIRKARNLAIRAAVAGTSFVPLHAPAGLRIAHGVTHFSITRQFAELLEQAVTPELVSYFKQVFVPEEKFYQTIAANLTMSQAAAFNSPGFEPYVGPGNWRYSNLHHIDPSLTKVYTDADWQEVMESSQYFLRKLELGKSDSLLDRIDEQLLTTHP